METGQQVFGAMLQRNFGLNAHQLIEVIEGKRPFPVALPCLANRHQQEFSRRIETIEFPGAMKQFPGDAEFDRHALLKWSKRKGIHRIQFLEKGVSPMPFSEKVPHGDARKEFLRLARKVGLIRKSEVNDAEEGSDEDKAALLQKALHKTLHKVLVYSEGYRLLRKEITLADLEELADDEKKKAYSTDTR